MQVERSGLEAGSDSALAVAERRVQHLAGSQPDGVLFIGQDGGIAWASRSMQDIVGWTVEELLDQPVLDLVEPGDVFGTGAVLRATLEGGPTTSRTVRMTTSAGQLRWFCLWFSVVDAGDGVLPPEALVSVRDVHEQRPEVVEMARQATRDPLTGLGNRAGLRRYLDDLHQAGASLAVAYCDLDGFRLLNDRFGHAVGDRILETTAARLARVVASAGAVFRLGGDEFIVAVPNVPERATAGIAERISEAMSPPVATTAGELSVSVAIGAVFAPSLEDVPALLERAQGAVARP